MDKTNEYEPLMEALAKTPEPVNLEEIYRDSANRFLQEHIGDSVETNVTRIRIAKLSRYAAALLFIAGIIGLIVVFQSGNGTGQVALADILEPFIQARTITFDLILRHSQFPDQSAQYSYLHPGHIRQELPDGTVTFV